MDMEIYSGLMEYNGILKILKNRSMATIKKIDRTSNITFFYVMERTLYSYLGHYKK